LNHIVYTHDMDGKKYSPTQSYNAFAEGNPENLNIDKYFVELALGSDDVGFPEYLKALEKIGYSDSLTIGREAGENRLENVKMELHLSEELSTGSSRNTMLGCFIL